MQQMSNIIRLDEGGASRPYVVLERFGEFATPQIPIGYKLIREQRNGEASLLLCKPIKDAEWSDISTDEEKKSQSDSQKGSNVDRQV